MDWVAATITKLRHLGVRIMTRTTVTGAYDGGIYGAVERVGLHLPGDSHLPRECVWRITAKQAVLATGATERPIAFPMNDRPGIMMAGAVRSYLHRYGVAPGKRVAVFATNTDAHRTADDLIAAGLKAIVIDPDEGGMPGGYDMRQAEVIGTSGRRGLDRIRLRRKDGRESWLDADCLAVSGGWNPNVHLTCHLGARPVWRADIAAFVPAEGAVPGLHPCGAAAGVFSTAECLASGADAAGAALAALGRTPGVASLPRASRDAGENRPRWTVDAPGRAWLDFANDVTTKDVRQSAAENFASVEHMKRYTTQGMAPDQGKNSNIAALAVLADATGRTIAETGTTTYRPPFVPVSLSALAAGARGKGFQPERLTTSHAAAVARGAPMVATGLWYRPSYFPARGESTWRDACDREVGHVRQAVGVADVSTLGKIDIQGPMPPPSSISSMPTPSPPSPPARSATASCCARTGT